MDIQAERDLLKDDYGNYYVVSYATKDSLTVVNAALYHAFNQMLTEDFVKEVKRKYPKDVAVGVYFADLVHEQIEKLEDPAFPGNIYDLNEARKEYDIHLKPIYHDSLHLK
ncbi:hypothetical protein [Planococcus dechangensis]|uniref:Uncharacterized protein n=1 Tax=Planococcus dechangensis TaxID=1176255 RepID=A0ABV9MAJ9_9BACL